MKLFKKPDEIEAVRYGNTETGEFEEGSVRALYDFLTLDRYKDVELSEFKLLSFIRPHEDRTWDPQYPELSALEYYNQLTKDKWEPIELGEWLVRDEPWKLDTRPPYHGKYRYSVLTDEAIRLLYNGPSL